MQPGGPVSFIIELLGVREDTLRRQPGGVADIVDIMRRFLQKQPAGQARVAVPAVIVHAAVGHIVDGLHHGDAPERAAFDQLPQADGDIRHAQREGHDGPVQLSLCGLTQRPVLRFADADGLFQKQRDIPLQDLDRQRRMQRAARADEYAVRFAAPQQRVRVFKIPRFSEQRISGIFLFDLLPARVRDCGDGNIRLDLPEGLQHGFRTQAVAEKGKLLCHMLRTPVCTYCFLNITNNMRIF